MFNAICGGVITSFLKVSNAYLPIILHVGNTLKQLIETKTNGKTKWRVKRYYKGDNGVGGEGGDLAPAPWPHIPLPSHQPFLKTGPSDLNPLLPPLPTHRGGSSHYRIYYKILILLLLVFELNTRLSQIFI